MDHLHRELAPISAAGWEVIDEEAKSRLPTYLAARKLVDFTDPTDGPTPPTNLGRISEITGPSDGVAAAQRRVLPLVELRTEFKVSRSSSTTPNGSDRPRPGRVGRGGAPDRVGENVTVFHGHEAAGLRGITESTSHEPMCSTLTWRKHPTASPGRQRAPSGRHRRSLRDGHLPGHLHEIVESAEYGGHLLSTTSARSSADPWCGRPGWRAGSF